MATSVHPHPALRRAWIGRVPRVAERVDLEVACVAGAAGVLLAGFAISGLVALTPLAPRPAGVVLVLLAAVVAGSGGARSWWRRTRTAYLQRRVQARTAPELARLDPARWEVRHGVPIGEGRTAAVVANADEVHLVVACWTPTRRAALHLRCALAAANAAARRLEAQDRRHDRVRRVVPTIVAWGPGAPTARAKQAPSTTAAVLLSGEVWAWRSARSTAPRTEVV